ncbi:MAG: hypothetical protein IJP12_04390 [Methanobrevibacter sp.]|nr:hypothetical protein [Methanobrevibacter sp.]
MFWDRFSFKRNDMRFRKYNLLILIVSLLLYLINIYFLTSYGDFFKFYFNDLFAVIILFSFLNVIYPVKMDNFWIILVITLIASFVWEYLALFIKPGSVFDYFDILAYFVSMVIYLILIYIIEGELNVSI